MPRLQFSVSYTTRAPRPGEVDGRDYSFISRQEFTAMIERGEFIEWAEVHGELYGTSRARLEAALNAGNDILLDIDTQGALQIKKQIADGVFIFILPPSLAALRARLERRMTDSPEGIERRLQRAQVEIETYGEYDYVIINDIFEEALGELASICIARRARRQNVNPLWIRERFFTQEGK